jgi:Ice-binding-like/WxL domain surface cell wall-binding
MRAAFTRASCNPRGFSWLTLGIAVMVAMAVLIATQCGASAAQSPVSLGTAGNYKVLAGTTVTSTGLTQIDGNLGVSPGTVLTGFPPGTITGAQDVDDAASGQAQSDLTAAYSDAAGRAPTTSVSGDIGGATLTPGVYNAASTLGITGTLTLDAQGDPDGVFIFQIGTTLNTASDSNVVLTDGAQADNVFWKVGSAATLGEHSTIAGNILAMTSITAITGAAVYGRVLVINGTITLDDNTISLGSVSLTAPATLSWTDTLNGYDQSVVDTNTSDQAYTVVDATGTGAGWTVTAEATPFTGRATGAVLPDATVFETNGDPASESDTSVPAASCATGSSCTLPTPSGSIAYPVQITVAGSGTGQPVVIYDAKAGSGIGAIVIADVGWWLNIPANARKDTYTSTITLAIDSGPAP